MKKFITSLIFLFCSIGFSEVKRISEIDFDVSKPLKLYIAPGRSTTIDFPCDINHSVLGLHGDITVKIGPDRRTSLILWLSNDSSQPTNLAVRCNDDVLIFDVYPNSYNHQDYLKISSLFDTARRNLKLISSSKTQAKHKKNGTIPKILIQTSTIKEKFKYRKKKLISTSREVK